MKSSQRSAVRVTKLHAKGMSRVLALLLLVAFTLIEIILGICIYVYGMREVGLAIFIFFLWNMSACLAMFVYLFSGGGSQNDGYIDVSNYLNLNKIAKNK